ncbi:3-oxoacyl-ACP synthase [Flavobacterium cauense R2A-7]|uniref:3-oxoacyl-[acyl-carrier-protein] synthase-3 n=1 Tax=Flavobacterium cauense R2A-7 TaxID=1341154 RepID=V6S919_9FLAO|nr:ketoacyl-ACP synthase III [Flavobacterium cauense]ESU20910.1 3-oxoacyl-ACP synthase [Flavobacterium cauense R2A-7]KGO82724.1 3-oxoacyl-ACP synthase [Flavobacterium cauense R2A-7]TWI12254.1 3-oxoacyl-[acyl-carrier-protein] synthase-3 [Flavobacterium cauense R2A-7]
MAIKITGSGCYIPPQIVTNTDFARHQFLNEDGSTYAVPNEVIAEKFKDITGIEERRYVEDNLTTSDIAFFAGEKAIEDSKIDPETLDYIIVAHNFGDVKHGAIQSDTVPSIAARVKHKLRIKNPKCVGYDVMFGCPGWIEGMIQAQAFIKAGMAKKCLVIGAETLSRVVDVHDRDSMIYSDGAGATVLELTDGEGGFLAHETASFTYEESKFLFFGKSYNVDHNPDVRYLKMYGRKIYEFALTNVPLAMKACLENSGIPISDLKKILIHQANEKMDEAIVQRFYKLYKQTAPENVMPMNIKKLGNSSVATIPTLYDLILKGKIENQELHEGDVILFASVGAGMNINAFVYRC